MLLRGIIEVCLGLVIISVFIPVFIALNSDFDLVQMLLDPLLKLIQGLL